MTSCTTTSKKNIFEHRDEDNKKDVDAMSGTHGVLKRLVADGKLWYVLLHTTPEKVVGFRLSRYVVLLAVGRSPNGGRLLGVITHQACYNLCDRDRRVTSIGGRGERGSLRP